MKWKALRADDDARPPGPSLRAAFLAHVDRLFFRPSRGGNSCYWLVWLAVGFLAGIPELRANAAASSPLTLTLADAHRQAFERNWDLLAARSDVDIATAQKLAAREFPNPILSVATSKINVDDHPSGAPGGNDVWRRSYDTVVAVNQLFEIGGKRASRRAATQAGFAAAQARFADARRLLDQAVTQAYVAALLGGTNRDILSESALALRKEAVIAETRLQAGDISQADKSQIEIAADRLELDAHSAMTTATKARIALEILMGNPQPTGNWTPADPLETLANVPTVANDSNPGVSRPDLLVAEAALQRTAAELRLQRALRIPDPTLLVQYEHEPPDQPNTLGLGVSFPLPLWNHNRGAIAAARSAHAQAEAQASRIRAQVAADLSIAQQNYADALARYRRQRDTIQPKSAQVRQTVTFAYEKGGASLLDLLSVQRSDNEVRLATVQAAADAAAAAAALKAAWGISEPAQPTGTQTK